MVVDKLDILDKLDLALYIELDMELGNLGL
jgi:hypothetical protein